MAWRFLSYYQGLSVEDIREAVATTQCQSDLMLLVQ